ncbi:HK97 gp10 family phage protein [Orenia marismortui]|uniref:Bacteriophage HK97-gp10 putative tail-component n=1 Tax=Orenia marismortui TaxID=46469 RepID=A0A4R8GZF9_9FIRM|nr:HK97 gp10 family phage protein [Orenia marismortui]TDX52141.1 bacteriophage HK97-gp10 putative tail-component [Orenia marismortui]
MSRTVSVADLAATITEEVKKYTNDVQQGIKKEVKSTATKVKKEIKDKSPRDTGEYADGWSRRTSTRGGQVEVTIYNKDKPQLTHLLEFGHALKDGGRVDGTPHIRVGYENNINEMLRNIEKIIKNGGG